MRTHARIVAGTLLAGLAGAPALSSCVGTVEGVEPKAPRPALAAPEPPRPWPAPMHEATILIAEEIVVEGPQGLVDHLALRPDAVTEYATETTPEGLRQELTLRAGVVRGEAHGWLDSWELVATRRLVALERFDDGPLVVRARGNATWRSVESSERIERDELRFVDGVLE